MNRFVVALVVLVLAGCTTSAKTHVVRGVSGIEIDCSGLGSGWDKCCKCAARECGAQSYKVIGRSSDAKEEEADYPFGGTRPDTSLASCWSFAGDGLEGLCGVEG